MMSHFIYTIVFIATFASTSLANKENILTSSIYDEFSFSTYLDENYPANELGSILKNPETIFDIVIRVNKSNKKQNGQVANIYKNNQLIKTFFISTGREKWELPKQGKPYYSSTPIGWYQPTVLKLMHFSKRWQTQMWWPIFFHGGIAIHGTSNSNYKYLGKRASGGCVRLKKEDAEYIYKMIENSGQGMEPMISRSGKVILNSMGKQRYHQSWKTLIIIEES